MTRRFQQILLGLLFVWVPLAFFVRAADGFTLTKELMAAVVVAFFALRIAWDGRWVLRSTLIQAALLFALWMILDSFGTGLLKMEVLKGSIHLILIVGTLLAVVFAGSRESYGKWIHFALGAGAIMAAHGLIQNFGAEKVNWTTQFESRAFSTLGNPNYLGGYLAALLPPAFVLTLQSTHRRSWLWFRAVTLLIFAGLLATRVRGAFLALAVAAVFTLIAFLMPWGRDLLRRNLRFVLAAFGILVLGASAYLARHGGLAAFSSSQVSVQQRVETYRVAWEMVKDHPWFGIGLGQLGVQFPRYQAQPFSPNEYAQHPYTYTEHVHNEFLQFWVEGGLPGLLLFLAVLAAFILEVGRFLKNPDSKAEEKELLIGVNGGLIALLVQSLSNFPLQIAPTAVLFGLFLAAPLAMKKKASMGTGPSSSTAQKVFLAAALLIPAVVGLRAVAASIAFRDTVGETSLGNVNPAVYYASRLVRLSPFNPKAWNAAARALELAGQPDAAYQAYQKAVELNPNYVENLVPMAEIRNKQGRFEEAVALCRQAETITPNYAAPIWPMAVGLFQLRRYDEAAQAFERYLVYVPNDFQTYLDLGVCYIQLKLKDKAIESWEKAYALNPNDPQVLRYLKSQGVHPK